MTATVTRLPTAAAKPVQARFDPATATEAETAAWLDGRQSVIDELADAFPFLRRHGVTLLADAV